MPSVSRNFFEHTLSHAHIIKEHGRRFEQMACSLEGRPLTQEQAKTIAHIGQEIQKRTQSVLDRAQLSLQNQSYLLDDLVFIRQHHYQVVLLHMEAVKLLLEATYNHYGNKN